MKLNDLISILGFIMPDVKSIKELSREDLLRWTYALAVRCITFMVVVYFLSRILDVSLHF